MRFFILGLSLCLLWSYSGYANDNFATSGIFVERVGKIVWITLGLFVVSSTSWLTDWWRLLPYGLAAPFASFSNY